MKKISLKIIQNCQSLRKQGLSHRDISKKLKLGLGTVYNYTKDIVLTEEQHLILKTKDIYVFNKSERKLGGLNCPNKFEVKYNKEDLIDFIQSFVMTAGRIPTKREVQSHKPYVRIFNSWNNAIKEAGFESNPVRFSKKRVANDGHKCDSFSEMIIDNWLLAHKIVHQVHVRYPSSKMSSDFLLPDGYRIEFFGLEGQLKSYDNLLIQKRNLIENNKYKVIEIKPSDLFPINKLDKILHRYCVNGKLHK